MAQALTLQDKHQITSSEEQSWPHRGEARLFPQCRALLQCGSRIGVLSFQPLCLSTSGTAGKRVILFMKGQERGKIN